MAVIVGGSSGAGAVVAVVIIVVGLGLYFLPTIVGAIRKVVNIGSVFAINLLLGWTLIGWAVALAMALRTNPPHAYPQFWGSPATSPPAQQPRAGHLDQLERLAALRERGALSDQEFQQLKNQALGNQPPQEPPRRRPLPWPVWVALAAAVLALAIALPWALSGSQPRTRSNPPSTSQPSAPPSSTPPSSTPAVATVNASLPLVSCPTSYGVAQPGSAPLPPSVNLTVPSDLASHLSVYSDENGSMKLVGPNGWDCSASVGADGSTTVEVFAPGEVAPNLGAAFSPQQQEAIVGSETSACVGCREIQACPLFTTAATDYLNDYGMSCPKTRPGNESTYIISSGVIAFEDPAGVVGDGNPSGGPYPANGVMTYYSGNYNGSWLDTCTMPNSDHALCTVALNAFVAWYGSA